VGHVLAQVVVEQCFQSWDPHLCLELVVQGPTKEPEDVASAGVEDAAWIVAERFEREPEDA
jgi:hypothetical protein